MTGSANMPALRRYQFFDYFTKQSVIMKTRLSFETPALFKILLPATILLLLAGQPTTLTSANPAAAMRLDSFPAVNMPCYRQFEKEMIQTAHSVAANATDIQSGVVNYVARVAQLSRRFYICLDKQYTHDKN
jgi:hypothetical protein